MRLGDLYRSAAADLALARRSWPGDPIVTRLEGLVGHARHLVYDSPGGRESVRTFFASTYWRLILERPAPLFLAIALLLVPLAAGIVWGLRDPAAASGMVPGGGPIDPAGGDLGLPFAEQTSFAAQIFTNNIQVTFLAFAVGIAAGIGTAIVLIYNGLLLGAVWGLAMTAGSGLPFFELVVAHGILELSCIVVASAAGMRIGWALVEPGVRRRADALREESQGAIQIILGTMPWLVLAGLIEGFVTPAGLGLGINLVIGLFVGAVFWTLAYVRGRTLQPAPALRP